MFLFNHQVGLAFGGESSGGGDLRAIQFKKIGEMLVDLIKNSNNLPAEVKQVNWKKLNKAVQNTFVESTNNPIIVNSKSEPAQIVTKDGFFGIGGKTLIIFNREQWDLIPDGSRRAALVLHEYLRAMGENDENYEISKFLYDNPTWNLLMNNIEATQPITDGIDLDFLIKCKYEYPHYTSVPYGTYYNTPPNSPEFTLGQGLTSSSSYHGKYIDRNDATGEVLHLIVYNESDPNLEIVGIPTTSSKSIRVILGWGQPSFFEMPTNIIFKQSVKITPNFNLNIELQNPELTLNCYRMTSEEVRKEGSWIPVGQGTQQ